MALVLVIQLLDENLSISYTYTDPVTRCFSTVTSEVFVSSTPININLQSDEVFCEDADPVTITGKLPAEHSGKFEVFSIANPLNPVVVTSGWSQTDSVSMVLNLKNQLPDGKYKIRYTALKLPSKEATPFKSEKEFIIEAIKTGIQIKGLENEYCLNLNASPISISRNISPGAGDIGKFFGDSLFTSVPGEHTAKFELSKAIAGSSYTINYIYTSVNGCVADTVSHTLTINPLPALSFTLNNNYNVEQDRIPLVGNKADPRYTFTGIGAVIVEDTLITQASRLGSKIAITYSGRDENQCYNEVTDSTIIYKASEIIQGFKTDSAYCYKDSILSISCNPIVKMSNGETITGTFRSKKNALEPNGKNAAKYYLKRAGSGEDTVYFDYKIMETSYTVSKGVYIDSIGSVTITSAQGFDLCKNSELTLLIGDKGYTGGGEGIFEYFRSNDTVVTISNTTSINPASEASGTYSIKYTFKSSRGCSSDTSRIINIFPVPVPEFSQPDSCPGIDSPVQFTNLTTLEGEDQNMKWEWSFEEGGTSTEKNPNYTYTSDGLKIVKLKAETTSTGCFAEISKDLKIGNKATADFKWDNECNTGEMVTFTSSSVGGNLSAGTYSWKLNDSVIPGDQTATYTFPGIGKYNMELIFKSTDNCTDTITKTIVIQPYIKFLTDLDNMTYFQDFESENTMFNWETKVLKDVDSTNWILGSPDGVVINKASGTRSWYTKIIDKNDSVNSQVVSPCFDLTGLEKPMIKLNIWSSSEFRRDGAVLQYSIDGGISWSNLGKMGEGINWFNSENIKSEPGAIEDIGWNEIPMESWTSARHSLDTLKGEANVRFRIAYASDGSGLSKVDGFAFDDIWIGERQQNILTEYFTNIQSTESLSANEYLNGYETYRAADLVPIHYHTAIPSGDPIHLDYKEGPSSRVFYYGVSQPPIVFSNGIFSSSLNNPDSKTAFENSNDIASLKDPGISLNIQATQSNITVYVTTNNDSLKNKNLVLYTAIVKDSVGVENEGLTKYYYNVLRKFLPNPGGVSLKTADFTAWSTLTESIPLSASDASLFIGSKLVVFVQNTATKEVYQSASLQLTATTSLQPENINMLIDMYPNPAEDYLFIDSQIDIETITILDISGRIVDQVKPEQRSFSIPVYDLKYGMYIVKGTTKKGEFMKKFIKQ